jgi:hypothetical protein
MIQLLGHQRYIDIIFNAPLGWVVGLCSSLKFCSSLPLFHSLCASLLLFDVLCVHMYFLLFVFFHMIYHNQTLKNRTIDIK